MRPIRVTQLPIPPNEYEYVHRRGRLTLAAVMPMPRWDGSEPCVGDPIYTDERAHGRANPSELAVMAERCNQCPRHLPCKEWAIAHEAHFYWAGTTPQDRKAIRAQRGQSLVEPAQPGSNHGEA